MFQPSQDTAKLSMTWLWGSKLLAASHTSDQAPLHQTKQSPGMPFLLIAQPHR